LWNVWNIICGVVFFEINKDKNVDNKCRFKP
jgi:hypothetical protein